MTLGVLISIVLPVLSGLVRELGQSDVERHDLGGTLKRVWKRSRKYVVLGMFSLITAGVLLAIYKASIPANQVGIIDNWAKAFLYGYAYDSTIQKITSGTYNNVEK
jgi:hypothetical protein